MPVLMIFVLVISVQFYPMWVLLWTTITQRKDIHEEERKYIVMSYRCFCWGLLQISCAYESHNVGTECVQIHEIYAAGLYSHYQPPILHDITLLCITYTALLKGDVTLVWLGWAVTNQPYSSDSTFWQNPTIHLFSYTSISFSECPPVGDFCMILACILCFPAHFLCLRALILSYTSTTISLCIAIRTDMGQSSHPFVG